MKVAINKGGKSFEPSKEAMMEFINRDFKFLEKFADTSDMEDEELDDDTFILKDGFYYAFPFSDSDEVRSNKEVIEILEKYPSPTIKIVEIPDGVEYVINEPDCTCDEYITEKHRIWF